MIGCGKQAQNQLPQNNVCTCVNCKYNEPQCECKNCECRKEYTIICSGCKSQFVSESNESITKCPNCPMTEDEFNKLILELERNQK
jgi:hypothetical protein